MLDELLVEVVEILLLLVFEEMLLFALFEQAEAVSASASAIMPRRFISTLLLLELSRIRSNPGPAQASSLFWFR